MKKNNF